MSADQQTAVAAAAVVLILAYKRKLVDEKKPDESSFDNVILGCRVKFKPNNLGHIVGAVPAERTDVIARMVDEIPEAYVLYEGEAVEDEEVKILTPADTEPKKAKFVLIGTNDDGSELLKDLKAMDDTALKAFAKESGFRVPSAAKGDTLRKAICAAAGQPVDESASYQPTPEELAAQ